MNGAAGFVKRCAHAFMRVRLATVLAALVYLYLVLPSFTVIPISFSKSSGYSLALSDMSLDLYREFFGSSDWMSALRNSAVVAAISAALSVVIGTPAAYAFTRGHFKGKALVQLMVLSPLFTPVIVMALGLYYLAALAGLTGHLATIVMAHCMYQIPFVIIMVMSALRQLDANLELAVMVMGASPLRVFLQVVLPQLSIAVAASTLFAFLVSFDEVVIAWFLTGPSSMTLPVRMYSSILWETTPVIAAISTLLTMLSFLVCLIIISLGRGAVAVPQGKA